MFFSGANSASSSFSRCGSAKLFDRSQPDLGANCRILTYRFRGKMRQQVHEFEPHPTAPCKTGGFQERPAVALP